MPKPTNKYIGFLNKIDDSTFSPNGPNGIDVFMV